MIHAVTAFTVATCEWRTWPEFPNNRTALFHPVLNFGKRFASTCFVELPAGSTTHSDRTDRHSTGHDSHPAGCISDIGQRRLRHRTRRILTDPVGDGFRAVFLA